MHKRYLAGIHKLEMDDGQQVFRQDKIIFIIFPDKIIIRTSLGQQFYLLPKAHYWQRRLNTIRIMVGLGEIRNLEELASWTNPGITWEPTSQKYDLVKEKALT